MPSTLGGRFIAANQLGVVSGHLLVDSLWRVRRNCFSCLRVLDVDRVIIRYRCGFRPVGVDEGSKTISRGDRLRLPGRDPTCRVDDGLGRPYEYRGCAFPEIAHQLDLRGLKAG